MGGCSLVGAGDVARLVAAAVEELAAARPRWRMGSRRWLLRLTVALLVLDLLGAGGVLWLRASDSATPVAVSDVVEQFRARAAGPGGPPDPAAATTVPGPGGSALPPGPGGSGGAGGAGAPAAPANPTATTAAGGGEAAAPVQSAPAAGVYVYATEGEESVDMLGGARHEYPPQTTVTVTHTACGHDRRWDVLEQRWDQQSLCRSERGIDVHTMSTYHEFFDNGEQNHFVCDPPGLRLPREPRVGDAWSGVCRGGGAETRTESRVVEIVTLTVGGTSVEAVHIRTDGVTTGTTEGEHSTDEWLERRTGLALRAVGHVDAVSDSPFGPARYQEQYRIDLESLEPQR